MPFGRCPISSCTCVPSVSSTTSAPSVPPRRLGGWLKMGIVGTTPARGRVLLVGDAAGLVNPMQGEGISQAMTSGRAAAETILSETEPRSRELSIQTCRRTPPVSSDRCRGARRAGGTAPGNCGGRSASDRGGPRRCALRRLGRLLERAPRWRTTQSASFGGERGDADRSSLDRAGYDGQVVQNVSAMNPRADPQRVQVVSTKRVSGCRTRRHAPPTSPTARSMRCAGGRRHRRSRSV